MRLALLVLLAPAIAAADPASTKVELIDRGDAVEVIAHDVKAARTAISPVRSRLEVPVIGTPRITAPSPADATVKVIEFDGGESRSLSVKLNFERADVKQLARFSQVVQVGNDRHMLIPRKLPPEGTGIVLPEPTLPPDLAAKLSTKPSEIKKPVGPAAAPEKPTEKPAPIDQSDKNIPVAKPAAGPMPPPAAEHAAEHAPATEHEKPAAEHAPPAATIKAAPSDDTLSKLATYAAAALALGGCALWLRRKKKAQQGTQSSIDVIAQRALGAKAKIVWLAAGNREMVVAVTPQQVRMLGQWKKGEQPAAALPEATAVDTAKPSSPAVAGIMRLRAKTNAPVVLDEVEGSARIRRYPTHAEREALVSDEVATGDFEADAAWAKEIIAATHRAGTRR